MYSVVSCTSKLTYKIYIIGNAIPPMSARRLLGSTRREHERPGG